MAKIQTVGNSVAVGTALGAVLVSFDNRFLHWGLGADGWASLMLVSIGVVSNVPYFIYQTVEAFHGKPPQPVEFPNQFAAGPGTDESRQAGNGKPQAPGS